MKPPARYQDIETLRTVLEVRYPKAHKYWDVSGGILEALEGRIPGLVAEKLGENGFSLKGRPDSGVPDAEFFWNRCAVARHGMIEPGRFVDAAATVWSIVWQRLNVTHLDRVGHRVAHFIPTDTRAAASDWIDRMPLWSLDAGLAQGWGVTTNEGVVLRTRTKARRVRLEVAVVEVAERTGNRTGLVVDVDITLPEDSVTRSSFVADEFLKENYKFMQQNVLNLLAGRASEDLS
jgi:hypothetical protein